MISKIILSLLLISSFTYAETVKEFLDNEIKMKKVHLEKIKSIKNPNDYLNEFNELYREFLDGKISVEGLQAINFYNDAYKRYIYSYHPSHHFSLIRLWQEFLIKNPNLNIKKIKSKFDFSRDGKYNGINTDDNIGNYYALIGNVTKIYENGIIVQGEFGGSAYIENIPQDISTFIQNLFKDYYKKYPKIVFIVKGNGYKKINIEGDTIIPKGSYVCGKLNTF